MAVGSHKDAFKAHQLVKKVIKKSPSSILGKMAADILLDFVKNQRQVTSDSVLEALPKENIEYDTEQLDKALVAVDKLCGKCDDAHDDSCFVNQARRVLIASRTGVDLGPSFDGETSLEDLLIKANSLATTSENPPEESSKVNESSSDTEILEDQLSELESLREQDVFRGTLIDEVVSTIQSVTDGNYATEMPIHEDEQLGKLAKAFNLMLSTVKNSMLELDSLVEERTAELKQIMNTVPVGLLSIDSNGIIMPEHSLEATKILGQETLRGRDFLDLIKITKRQEKERSEMNEFLDVVRMGMLSDEDLAPLNPFPELELKDGDTTKYLQMRYSAVKRNAQPTGDILVEINDITEEKRLAAEVDASQKENLQLKVIAEDPDLFREFLGEVMSIQAQVRSSLELLSTSSDWLPIINEMFRGIHTIKGAAGSFALTDLAEVAGLLENDLSVARSASTLTPEFIEGIRTALHNLDSTVTEACETASAVLGEELSTDGPSLRIPLSEVKEIDSLLADTPETSAVKEKLNRLMLIPAHRGLSRSVKIVPDLIARLGKEIDFIFDGKDVMLDFEKAHEINTPLIHLLRNACDHGIETAEERGKTAKPPKASVTMSVKVEAGNIQVDISDDGKGMDPELLASSAVKKSILTPEEASSMSDSEKLKLIFRPGFSTAEAVTDVSGRGVGLDAVNSTIEDDLKGKIIVNSVVGKGTTFSLQIPN